MFFLIFECFPDRLFSFLSQTVHDRPKLSKRALLTAFGGLGRNGDEKKTEKFQKRKNHCTINLVLIFFFHVSFKGAITSEANLTLQRAMIDYSIKKINTKFSKENIIFDLQIVEIPKENSFKALKFGRINFLIISQKINYFFNMQIILNYNI